MRRIAATAATLAVCLLAIVARPAPAAAQSGKFQEAPALAEQVKEIGRASCRERVCLAV